MMCGIAGSLREPGVYDIENMLINLRHRGPDGQGINRLQSGTLGHTRLAIIDVEGGHQPMGYGRTWIVFNGEIYNFRALAAQYLRDVHLQTHSDTEVIIHLYRKFGPDCVQLLDGMFALVILDGDQFLIARDPLGIKPLYIGESDGTIYFASEIKSLARAVNEIREFPPGHWFHSTRGWFEYYQICSAPINTENEVSITGMIRETLEEAVLKRLLADVPVGISLSGGLDSSIVALLASMSTENLLSFAVGMEGSEDLAAARKMAGILGTCHHERIYTEQEMLKSLPKILYHLESFDPALVRSAIPNYFLAEMASEYVKVILTGEGADEIYAGYDYLQDYTDPRSLQKEMILITSSLHNTNLQRADRIPMAFGLEARVPFLDVKSVALGLGLPAAWKMHQNKPAKYLLRQAFRTDLPPEIVDRPKQKFSEGAGSSDVIALKAMEDISHQELSSERERLLYQWNYHLQNREALYYYRILHEFFEDQWIFPSLGKSRSL